MEIIGHKEQREFLKKSAELNRISHAYLFCGQEKLGKKTIALEWISWLIEQSEMKKRIKFSSPDESRMAKVGSKKQAFSLALADVRAKEDLSSLILKGHPDLIFLEPTEPPSVKDSREKPTGKKEIRISQIRELIWKLSLKPYSASFKAVIIDQAHLMNSEAQTCLLKTLEEPKGETFLILITEMPESLFPTIRSRVENIKFYPVKKEEIKNYLKKQGISEKDSEEICKLSRGRPGVAIDFVSNPQKVNLFQEKIRELDSVSNSDVAIRFQYAKNLSQNLEIMKEVLDIWLSHFRTILFSMVGNRKPEIDNKKYSIDKLKNILKLIQTTKFLILTTNINARLALEILMLEL